MGPSTTGSGRTWDEATSPAAIRLVRRFEAAWRGATDRRPCPSDFLPEEAGDCPGARLALLRSEISLRWEAGERVGAAWYLQNYPDLSAEALVALIYEEFCLREEEGEEPDPADYLVRFPNVATQLGRVFDIHRLIGSNSSATVSLPGSIGPPFPEAGQTIAGFHLVEELGRGAFARVFLAEERQLADRPVALKVARVGSREPQTLARLQHTHIVPIHSSRTDPATGLHLLCMPYFGRLTLAQILADPALRTARTGDDLLAVLDRLGSSPEPTSGRSTGRAALRRRSYAQAIAWWGARMAEALDHAHDRGILHRDIKPSNVLVTSDGMPMLLDFHLAREPVAEGADIEDEPAALGGTIDYMAPEHLEALADGLGDIVDARADIYSLGVLLYEVLTGTRPFTEPKKAVGSVAELLLRAAERRRNEPPRLRALRPDVPVALETVVRRCLAPQPDDRYANAGEAAADLQAVANDQPLRFAREPLVSRTRRWVRRRRRSLAMAAAILIPLAIAGVVFVRAEIDNFYWGFEAQRYLDKGFESARLRDFAAAKFQFDAAAKLAGGERSQARPSLARFLWLEAIREQAQEQYQIAEETEDIRSKYRAFLRLAEPLRFRLIGVGGDLASAGLALKDLLRPFHVLEDGPNWTERAKLARLDGPQRERLLREINQLLFLWVVALERSGPREAGALQDGLSICDRALAFAEVLGPWRALRARLGRGLRGGSPSVAEDVPEAVDERSDLACFQWGALRGLERGPVWAIPWLERAVALKPDDYWYEYYLARSEDLAAQTFDEQGRPEAAKTLLQEALEHNQTALALEPRSPWVRFGRARLERMQGKWGEAAADLETALRDFHQDHAAASDATFERMVGLERGLIDQSLGAWSSARREYEGVIARGPRTTLGRAARLNRAQLDADSGAIERAWSEYGALLREEPSDITARLGRALLALRCGRAREADQDLSDLIERRPSDPGLLAHRARARLALGHWQDAVADADAACRLAPSPSRERLRTQSLIVGDRLEDLGFLDDPDELAKLTIPRGVLLRVVERFGRAAQGSGVRGLEASRTRAVILSVLGDPGAVAEAGRAIELAPLSAGAYLVRARVYRRLGAIASARADIERGLALDGRDPRLLDLRSRIEVETGDPSAALADADRALYLGASGRIHASRAQALFALNRVSQAISAWTEALRDDPEDPSIYLGRARAFLRLSKWDQALADLEQAAGWSGDDPRWSVPIALAYARCLPQRPDRLGRVAQLAWRAWGMNAGKSSPRSGKRRTMVQLHGPGTE
jgi:serine/threonine protein kinase/tetratricopeptide (TPR) repeat protein